MNLRFIDLLCPLQAISIPSRRLLGFFTRHGDDNRFPTAVTYAAASDSSPSFIRISQRAFKVFDIGLAHALQPWD